jgi:hypothetical protein
MSEAKKPTRARRFAREPKPADPGEVIATSNQDTGSAAVQSSKPIAKAASKISGVIVLLQRAEGATLAEIVAATGWQPHTTRAALTGLKKKGHSITRDKRDEVTCYRIAEPV